ncbi:hypothetical protein MPDQ_003469 [Monascus purpureus]|uniref:EGF domain-specific O-linked N-acetylglucosamine transferase n=1 Tax=Monascus purpureus TaxID=5098 RepID=A0A507R309_MONPU|nr:hypothetical protein MPDQ_003469 [Monascus purpureus]
MSPPMETPTPMPAFAPGERPVLLLDLSGLDDDDNDDDNDNDDDVAVAVGITGMDIVDGPAPVELTIIVAADVVNSDMSFCSYATVIACTHGQMPADGGGSKFCVSGSGEDGRAGLEAGYELTQPAVSGVLVSDEAGKQKQKQKRKYAILVKREASNYNLWHSLLEIFSVQMSMDVLRMFTGEEQEKEDINAKVIILDELHDGPVFDLWSLHPSSTKPIRLNEMTKPTETMNIVLPLPGGSNPFWQGDWEDLPCQRSELLRVFVERVLVFYRLDIIENESESADSGSKRKTVVTFIDRREKRRLINQEQHLASLRDALFNTTTTTTTTAGIKVVDFAALSFEEQLRVVRETDVLVGVHGAGLTHGMFLRPGSAMVEILPGGLEHRGFRNLARQMGHRYFCVSGEAQGDWQQSDVGVGEEFVGVVLDAIHTINGMNG